MSWDYNSLLGAVKETATTAVTVKAAYDTVVAQPSAPTVQSSAIPGSTTQVENVSPQSASMIKSGFFTDLSVSTGLPIASIYAVAGLGALLAGLLIYKAVK